MPHHPKPISAVFALLMIVAVPAVAAPQPIQQGDITYVTGGTGLDERNALEAEAAKYSLEITNANPNGDYTTDDALTIKRKDGQELLHLGTTGPLLYAQLPAGDYVIHATNGGQEQTHEVRVGGARPTVVRLIWPQ